MLWKSNLCKKTNLKPTECFIAIVTLVALCIDTILILIKGIRIDYLGYIGIASVAFPIILVGLFYRTKDRSERIASTMICSGLFILFSASMSMFNYMMLPLARPTIDISITAIDAALGFSWPDVMAFAAQYPTIVFIMKLAYMSTMAQFALLVVILGLLGRARELHIMITMVTITATLTICFWGLFPSLGAKSLYNVSPEIWQIIDPPVNREYALDLINIATNGVSYVTPSEIRGLIAFPSYHAVLAFIAIYSAWNVRFVRPIFLAINLMILPGIFIHGGHHFLDLPAGFAMFLLGVWIARKVVYAEYIEYDLPVRIHAT